MLERPLLPKCPSLPTWGCLGDVTACLSGRRLSLRMHRTLGGPWRCDRNDHRRATSGPGDPSPGEVGSGFPPFHTIDGFSARKTWISTVPARAQRCRFRRRLWPTEKDSISARDRDKLRFERPGTSNAVSDWATVSFTPVHWNCC